MCVNSVNTMSSAVSNFNLRSASRPSLLSAKLQRTARYNQTSQRRSIRTQCRSTSGGPEDPRQTDFLQQCRIEANRFTEVARCGATNFTTLALGRLLHLGADCLLCIPAAIRHTQYWRRRTGLHQLLLVTVHSRHQKLPQLGYTLATLLCSSLISSPVANTGVKTP